MDIKKKIRLHPEKPIDVPDVDPFQNDQLGFKDFVVNLSDIIDQIEGKNQVGTIIVRPS